MLLIAEVAIFGFIFFQRNPSLISNIKTQGSVENVFVSGNYVYLAVKDNKFPTLTITNSAIKNAGWLKIVKITK